MVVVVSLNFSEEIKEIRNKREYLTEWRKKAREEGAFLCVWIDKTRTKRSETGALTRRIAKRDLNDNAEWDGEAHRREEAKETIEERETAPYGVCWMVMEGKRKQRGHNHTKAKALSCTLPLLPSGVTLQYLLFFFLFLLFFSSSRIMEKHKTPGV